MAALVLSVAGSAIGGAVFGPAGAIAGRLVGAIGGNLIDRALFGGSERQVEGPRLADLDVMASTEGAPIPRVYGRARLAGQVIWATKLEEAVSTQSDTDGGGKGSPQATTNTTTYSYFANFAVGLSEGPIGRVGRIWADGKLLDLVGLNYRIYTGSETQTPDPLIVAREGAGNAPAYRGLAYIVFERMPLADFGNRIPQLSFEIVRPIGRLEKMVRAVTLIPGTTEFGYEMGTVIRLFGPGQFGPENRHAAHAVSDVQAALDDLQAACPNLERVAIVVAWFGGDLRAQHFTLTPKVDSAIKQTFPENWAVAGITAQRRARRLDGRRPAGVRRHAVGPERDAPDPGTERARAEGHALSVRDDGHSGRQRARRSIHRRSVAAGLSMARAYHLRSGAGAARLAGRHRRGRDADRCVLRCRRFRTPGAIAAWCCTTRSLPRMRAASMRFSSARSCAP